MDPKHKALKTWEGLEAVVASNPSHSLRNPSYLNSLKKLILNIERNQV